MLMLWDITRKRQFTLEKSVWKSQCKRTAFVGF